MVFPYAAAISGGSNIFGSIIGAIGANSARKAQKAEAQRNREFQQAMYQHRYQWQMEDMRRAGLNPILSYKMGAPSGASPSSISPVNVGAPIQEGIGKATASALQAARQKEEIDLLKAQSKKANTETKALGGAVARSKMEERAFQGDRGYLYYLLNNARGSTVSRAIGALMNLGGSNSAKSVVQEKDLPPRPGSKRDNRFSKFMHRTRKKVFGPRKSSKPDRYDWQKGGIEK